MSATRRDLTIGALTAVLTATVGLVVGLIAAAIVLTTLIDSTDLVAGIVLIRTLLVGGALFLLVRAIRNRTGRGTAGSGYELTADAPARAPFGVLVAGGLVGGLLNPFAWEGRALIGQWLFGANLAATLIDLVLWGAIVALAARD